MPDWCCRKCGAINLEGQRLCEACAAEAPVAVGAILHSVLPSLPRGQHVVRSEPLPDKRPNTTAAQNKAAIGVVHAVARGEITEDEGQRRLREIFPQLQEGY